MKREEESEEVRAPSRFTPSEEWLAAFRRAYNEVLVQLAAEYAAERMAGIGENSVRDKHYPRTLVLHVLTDTFLGIVRWDHHTPLVDHVKKVIRSRSRIDWKRARKRAHRRYRHLYIEATTTNGRSRALEEADRIFFERQTDRERAAAALEELRARAADDPELLAYLDALQFNGSRMEVLRQTGLPPERYRQMRRRLVQLIKQLSIEARPLRGYEGHTP
ncbi:MAG TPA: hypothetical protein VFT22_36305 [Kofleriaceae bacterium]|nr:hypothetical protein [Kofleriaceae bacterium]